MDCLLTPKTENKKTGHDSPAAVLNLEAALINDKESGCFFDRFNSLFNNSFESLRLMNSHLRKLLAV